MAQARASLADTMLAHIGPKFSVWGHRHGRSSLTIWQNITSKNRIIFASHPLRLLHFFLDQAVGQIWHADIGIVDQLFLRIVSNKQIYYP